MFDKFGELNSYTEINELAEKLFNEGDEKSLREMAEENGILKEYMDCIYRENSQHCVISSLQLLGKSILK